MWFKSFNETYKKKLHQKLMLSNFLKLMYRNFKADNIQIMELFVLFWPCVKQRNYEKLTWLNMKSISSWIFPLVLCIVFLSFKAYQRRSPGRICKKNKYEVIHNENHMSAQPILRSACTSVQSGQSLPVKH